MEEGAEFYHEWRDDSSPYRVGPSLWIAGGKLSVGGKPLAEVATSQWVHVEIRARGWATNRLPPADLTITVPGKPAKSFTALPCDPQWKKLDWLGFVSNADRQTVFYPDNLFLENRPAR